MNDNLYTIPALSSQWSLAEVVERLQRHAAVDGLLLVGSAADGQLTVTSDYDLLIVLDAVPVQPRVGLTLIDGREADLLFATTSELDQLLTTPMVSADSWLGRIGQWCQKGTLLFDRNGRLDAIQRKVATAGWLGLPTHQDGYATWFSINYNLRQTKRLGRSTDPVIMQAVEMRLLYSVSDLMTGYFVLRGLAWPGEKAALRHWQAYDPAYFALCTAYHAAPDRATRLHIYAALAAHTVAPYGGLWSATSTAFRLAQHEEPANLKQMLELWTALLDGDVAASSDQTA